MTVRPRVNQGGVALAIVVWFIAGMSLLVAGIVGQAKADLRLAQLHLATAKAAAAGDGAINLMLAALVDPGSGSGSAVLGGQFRLGDETVRVRLIPASGLVDVNLAPRELLVQLFIDAGIAGREEAEALADNVIQLRAGGGRGARRLGSPEELLVVEGFDRLRLEALRDYLVFPAAGSTGGFDPALAPDNVLAVYARTFPERAAGIRRARSGGAGSAPAGSGYRADALVEYGGRQWLRRRWVQLGEHPWSSLPWHFTRTEAPRVEGAG